MKIRRKSSYKTFHFRLSAASSSAMGNIIRSAKDLPIG